jgi:hypothetical protein
MMKIPDLIGNDNYNEAFVISNRLWERIKNWKENSAYVTLRNYKAECLIGMNIEDDAEIIVHENLRQYGNNIVSRLLKLKIVIQRNDWNNVRRMGYEAEDIINKVVEPIEGDAVAA